MQTHSVQSQTGAGCDQRQDQHPDAVIITGKNEQRKLDKKQIQPFFYAMGAPP